MNDICGFDDDIELHSDLLSVISRRWDLMRRSDPSDSPCSRFPYRLHTCTPCGSVSTRVKLSSESVSRHSG